MTIITIYPLFSNDVNIQNLIKYAADNSLSVINTQSLISDSNTKTTYAIIQVSQTLSSGQKTAISTIFQGSAYITFT